MHIISLSFSKQAICKSDLLEDNKKKNLVRKILIREIIHERSKRRKRKRTIKNKQITIL